MAKNKVVGTTLPKVEKLSDLQPGDMAVVTYKKNDGFARDNSTIMITNFFDSEHNRGHLLIHLDCGGWDYALNLEKCITSFTRVNSITITRES